MSGKLKIGIVGCGTIADIQAQAIQQSGNLEMVSLYSRSGKNASGMGEKFNVRWHTDWDKFIADPLIDAVSICTPSGNHLDYGEMSARAGKHVIVEKPIEITIERAKRLIQVCVENRVALAVIYQSRFIPEIEEVKGELDKHVIGKLIIADANIKWFRSQDYYDSGAWRGTFALDGGGVLINQAIHTIDLFQWFMGDVKSIFGKIATLTHERLEGEDNAMAVVEFKSGAIGVITGSTSIQPAQPRHIELHGEKGSIIIDGDDVSILKGGTKPAKQEKAKATGASSPLQGFSIEPHKKQFEAIADAISKGHEPPVSGKDSLKSLAIVLGIYESSKTGLPVDVGKLLE
ncbi:MAG: Gfo/Idh/MocA family oxidoreductase [Bacteroidales bacterium]|nr:Gfo/Idh/MocA family oxidoreductase [Bacteroidales bacterium]